MEAVLAESAVRALLVAGIAALGLRLTGMHSPSARHRAWTAVTVSMLVLPAWTARGPKLVFYVLPPEPAGITTSLVETETAQTETAKAFRPVENRRVSQNPMRVWPQLLRIVYVTGVLILLARFALGIWVTRRAFRNARIEDGHWTSATATVPWTGGWIKPVIVLPEGWKEWPRGKLDAVLIHENAHVRRRDPLIRSLAMINRAVFWFHPLAWWLEQKLSMLAEEASDEAVLDRGHGRREYAGYLIEIARAARPTRARIDAGIGMADGPLATRLRRILEGVSAPPPSRMRIALAALVCALPAAMLAVGAVEPRPAVPPLPVIAASTPAQTSATPQPPAPTQAPPSTPASTASPAAPSASDSRTEIEAIHPSGGSALPVDSPLGYLGEIPTAGPMNEEALLALIPPSCGMFTLQVIPPAADRDFTLQVTPPLTTGDEPMVKTPCRRSFSVGGSIMIPRRWNATLSSEIRDLLGEVFRKPEGDRGPTPKTTVKECAVRANGLQIPSLACRYSIEK